MASTAKRSFSLINDNKSSPNKESKKKSKTNLQTNNLLNYFISNKKTEKIELKSEDDQKENMFSDSNNTNELNIKKETDDINIKQVKNAFEIMKTSTQKLNNQPNATVKKSNSSLNIKEETYNEESESQPNNKIIRKCPFYKRIEGTQIAVDAFSYGDIENCNAYFLSHYHYDHFVGLTKHFKHKIFCSKITANLVIKQLKVDKTLVNPLELNKFNIIYPNDDSIQVALLDANQ
jgi:hypothetical protein